MVQDNSIGASFVNVRVRVGVLVSILDTVGGDLGGGAGGVHISAHVVPVCCERNYVFELPAIYWMELWAINQHSAITIGRTSLGAFIN